MQNFRTRNVRLNQAQYEATRSFPSYTPPRHAGFSPGGYRVVDIVLRDGSEHEGLLLVGDDMLLVPEAVAEFSDTDIVEIHPTPIERHPDFAITDPSAVWNESGIETGNLIRLDMFGSEEGERDWRSAAVEEAHEEALEDDHKIETFAGEIPACYHGPHLDALVPGGVRISYFTASAAEDRTQVVRPKTAELWRAIIDQTFEIDPGFTLGELVELLDLPEAVDREVLIRTMPPWKQPRTFQPWVEMIREEGYEPDREVEWLEVHAGANVEDDLTYTFYFDSRGKSTMLKEDDPATGFREGDRINWSLWGYGAPAGLRHVPLRYNPELLLPVPHEELMAHLRGPRRDWELGGRQGPEPEIPARLRAKRTISFGEFIGALLGEIGSQNRRKEGLSGA